MKLLFRILPFLLLTSCIPLGKNTHLIVGIGVFHTDQTNAVKVMRADTLGVHAGDGRVNLGLSRVLTASIPTNSNTVLEIKR